VWCAVTARGVRRANSAAIEGYNKVHDAEVETQQVKYLNNVVEQDHRAKCDR
jgi:transposase-like protein